MTTVKVVPVVGVTFAAGYPKNLLRLAGLVDDITREGPVVVALVRNPTNKHDTNAVEVHVPALGWQTMIGHVSRDNAARLAPLMDAGTDFDACIYQCRINPEHLERPGIDIGITRAPVEAF